MREYTAVDFAWKKRSFQHSIASCFIDGTTEIHLYYCRLNDHIMSALLNETDVLSAKEFATGNRFLITQKRNEFFITKVLTRKILADYLNIPPSAIEFDIGPNGKPSLTGVKLYFNVSHSAEHFILAVSNATEIGIDLEVHDTQRDFLNIAKRYFPASDYESILCSPMGERWRCFLKLWTAREASSKCSGGQLSHILSVDFEKLETMYHLLGFPITDSCFCTLATPVQQEIQRVEFFKLSEEKLKFSE